MANPVGYQAFVDVPPAIAAGSSDSAVIQNTDVVARRCFGLSEKWRHRLIFGSLAFAIEAVGISLLVAGVKGKNGTFTAVGIVLVAIPILNYCFRNTPSPRYVITR